MQPCALGSEAFAVWLHPAARLYSAPDFRPLRGHFATESIMQNAHRLFARRHRLAAVFPLAVGLLLGACSAIEPAPPPAPTQRPGLFGANGLSLLNLGGNGPRAAELGVNSYLWRATLDTLSFLPLTSADPFGGVILTDWYSPPTTNGSERLKLNVLILDQRLRSDGVKVTVFRQERAGNEWRDAPANAATGTELENAILTRARQLWLDANAAP